MDDKHPAQPMTRDERANVRKAMETLGEGNAVVFQHGEHTLTRANVLWLLERADTAEHTKSFVEALHQEGLIT